MQTKTIFAYLQVRIQYIKMGGVCTVFLYKYVPTYGVYVRDRRE